MQLNLKNKTKPQHLISFSVQLNVSKKVDSNDDINQSTFHFCPQLNIGVEQMSLLVATQRN